MFARAIKEKSTSLLVCLSFMALVGCAATPPGVGPLERSSLGRSVPKQAPLTPTAPISDSPLQHGVSPETASPGDKITIAIMLPLTGPEAETGNVLLRAAIMALFDAVDPRLTLLPLDTKADPEETKKVALRAIEENAAIVIGPLLSENLLAAGEILGPAGIPIISFSNDSSAAASGRFIMGFLPETEVKRVVDFAISEGLLNHAALIPEGRYGERVVTAFGKVVSDAGAVISAIERYPPDSDAVFEPVKRLSNFDKRKKDMRDEVRFLRSLRSDMMDDIAKGLEQREVLDSLNYDAVLVPEGGALLRTLAPLLPFYELDPKKIKLLGTGLWSDKGLLREPPLQGAWFAAPEPQGSKEFQKRFENNFSEEPLRIASLAYDAVSLVALLARPDPSLEGEQPFSINRLTNNLGFMGIDGLFRFLPDGTIERALAILEVRRRGFLVVDPAPTSFPRFGFALKAPDNR